MVMLIFIMERLSAKLHEAVRSMCRRYALCAFVTLYVPSARSMFRCPNLRTVIVAKPKHSVLSPYPQFPLD